MKNRFFLKVALSLLFISLINLNANSAVSFKKTNKPVDKNYKLLKARNLFLENKLHNSYFNLNVIKNDIPKLQLGFSFGENLSDLIQDIKDPQKKFGASYGILGIYNIDNDYGLQLELNFCEYGIINKEGGFSGFGTSVSSEIDAETTYDYLQIPFMLKRYFGTDIKFYLNAGFYFSFLRSAQIVGEETISTTSSSGMTTVISYDLHDDLLKETLSNDYGFVGGTGVLFPLGSNMRRGPKLQLLLDVRYSYGFADITLETTNEYSGITSDIKSNNSIFTLKTGLLINW